MKNGINYQWQLMRRDMGFKISFLLMMIYSVGSVVYTLLLPSNAEIYSNLSADAIYAGGMSPLWYYFREAFPFLAVLPFSLSYINDRDSGIIPLVLSRGNTKEYFLSKTFVCFCGSAIIILLPLAFNLSLCHIALPSGYNYPFGSYGDLNFSNLLTGETLMFSTKNPAFPFLRIFLRTPVGYNILYILLLSLFSGLLGVVPLCLSFLIKRYRVLLFVPNFILLRVSSVLEQISYNRAIEAPAYNYTNYRIMDYLGPFTYVGQNPVYIFSVVLALVLFCVICCTVAIRRDELLDKRMKHDKN